MYGAYVLPAGTTDFSKGIGTGPFMLKEWQPGTAWSVVRNPKYWAKGQPLLDGVNAVSIPEPSTKAQAVIAGKADITDVDYDLVPLIKGAGSKINVNVAKAIELFNVTMDPTAKPFTDNRVRTAMKVGLDRARLIKVAYAGYGTMAIDSPAPVNDKLFFPKSLASRMKPDHKASNKLLNEAGHPNGLDLTLITSSEPPLAKFSLAFADAMQGSGFNITVQNHPSATYWDQIWMHNAFCVSDWTRRNPIEAMSVMLASNSSQNEAKFHSKELDALLAKSLRTGGAQQQAVVKAGPDPRREQLRRGHPRLSRLHLGVEEARLGPRLHPERAARLPQGQPRLAWRRDGSDGRPGAAAEAPVGPTYADVVAPAALHRTASPDAARDLADHVRGDGRARDRRREEGARPRGHSRPSSTTSTWRTG